MGWTRGIGAGVADARQQLLGGEPQSPEQDEQGEDVTRCHPASPGAGGGPDAGDDEREDRCEVCGDGRAAAAGIGPEREPGGEGDDEQQAHDDPERGADGVMALSLAALRLASGAQLLSRRLRRETVVFALDLAQLLLPVDLGQMASGLCGRRARIDGW